MYNKFQLAFHYFKYYLSASGSRGHGTHSPFVFEFITRVLNDRANYPGYTVVEKLRSQLLSDDSILTVDDLGAGSSVSKRDQRSVSSIAKNAAKPAKFGQLLYRMVRYYKPRNILELGTSLGISTCYLGLANPAAQLLTLEGAPAIAQKARQNFDSTGLSHYTLAEGNFDESLPVVLDKMPSVGFAFIDGNHRQEPTERYFREILEKINNDSILVFDDIHWSREMEKAWATIKAHPAVRCTIDLFFIGIVVFRQEFHEKQHFTIRF